MDFTFSRFDRRLKILFVVMCGSFFGFAIGSTASTADAFSPLQASAAPRFTSATQVAAGSTFSCARLSDGTVKCWGANDHGQLGRPTLDAYSSPPVETVGISSAAQVAAGSNHVCALLADGTVRCWGRNESGEIGDGTTTDRSTPTVVSGISGAVEVASGHASSCALLADGVVKCWGSNESGQLGDGTITDRKTPVSVATITNASHISVGVHHSCAVLRDGTAQCWGGNWFAQTGDGARSSSFPYAKLSPSPVMNVTDAIAITSGDTHSCVLLKAHTLKCWGNNASGKLGNGVSADYTAPVTVSGVTEVQQVAAGGGHTCAVITGGAVQCWGSDEWGQLGDKEAPITDSGDFSQPFYRLTPSTVSSITNAAQLDAGSFHSCAVLTDGGVECWGTNQSGQLDGGSAYNSSSAPRKVSGVSTQPLPLSRSSSSTATFTGDARATLECSLDDGAYTECVSPLTFTSLPDGLHTLRVRQTDIAGNRSDSVSETWTVDTTPPGVPSLSGVPGSVSNSSGASMSFSGEPGAAFSCSTDGSSFTSCTSPLALTGLTQGQHSVAVKQTDQAGNTSGAVTAAWTVDLTAPSAPILSAAPASKVNSTDASISFSGEAGAVFACSVDGGAYASCSSPKVLTGLGEGPHSLGVKQTDLAGNASTPSSASWVVDLTAPSAPSLSGAPPAQVNSASASVSFTGEAGGSFSCSVDGAAYSACSSPKSVSGLSEGAHSLAVKQIDLAGNTSIAATSTWTVDLTAPSAPGLQNGPAAQTNSTSASISFSGESAAVFSCSVDGGSFSACTSPKALSGLTEGSHSLAVKQTDLAGNTGTASTTSWNVDLTSPGAPTLSGAPAAQTNSTSVSIGFTGESGAVFSCSVNGGSFSACTSPKALSGLAEGAHSLAVRQTDVAGNTSAAATASWTVDTTSPAAPVFGNSQPAPTNKTSAQITFSGEAYASFQCSLDGGGFSSCSSPYSLTGLAEGQRTVAVKQTDRAGNTSIAGTVSWTVDLTAPAAPVITSPTAGAVSGVLVNAAFNGESGANFECRIDGSAWAACSSPLQHDALANRVHRVEVRQTDGAGNVSAASSVAWTTDSISPDSVPQVATGDSHTCAIGGTAGIVKCWGYGDDGQTLVPTGTYTRVSAGTNHTCGLTTARSIKCWGFNGTGATAAPTGVFTQVAAGGSHSCAITTAGVLKCWGLNDSGQSTVPDGTYTQVSAGATHTCAITTDSDLRCWGNSGNGRLTVPDGKYAQVSAGFSNTCAVTTGGSARCWGDNTDGKSTPPDGNYTQVSAGKGHSCAITTSGGAVCWGKNTSGQNDIPAGTFAQISAGGTHTCATQTSTRVRCWGGNDSGQTTVPDIFPPPLPAIASGPNGTLSNRAAEFGFTGVKGNTFECSLDGGAWAACTSPKKYTGLVDGDHKFRVRQLNASKNPGAAAETAWTIDATAPAAPEFEDDVPSVVAEKSLSISFGGENGGRFECRVDGKAWAACTSPFNATGLADGSHTFEVRQVDDAKNTGVAKLARWSVDTVKPKAPTLTGVPAGTVRAIAARVVIAGEAGGSFQCRLDDADWATCTTPFSAASLQDGQHKLDVRQIDAAHNVGDPRSVTWTVDTKAPVLLGDVMASKSGKNMFVDSDIADDAEKPATLEWSNAKTIPSNTAAPNAKQVLNWGKRVTVVAVTAVAWVRVSDAPGNWSVWVATKPALQAPTLGGLPTALTRSKTATITFVGERGIGFECSLDDADWAACTSPLALSGLTDGAHTLVVHHVDGTGAEGADSTAKWSVDTTPPALTGKIKTTRSGKNLLLDTTFDPALGKPAQLEYSLVRTQPKDSAVPNAKQVLTWAARVTVVNQTAAYWVRVNDPAGNWSPWAKLG